MATFPIDCCPKMTEQSVKGELISVLENVPFDDIGTDPTAYILSDGGHGGIEPISFCPFCGKKIEIRKI